LPGLGGVAPAVEFDPLALLQVLVVLEEVADALEPVRADLGDVVDVAVAGEDLVHRHRQQLLVAAGLVAHAQHADRAAADHRAGDQRQGQDHQHVRRVAVATHGARDVAVVARIAHRRGQDAVDEDRPAVLVDLVLDRFGVLGNLDDDVDFFGDVVAGGDVVQAHGMAIPAQGAGSAGAGRRGGWEGLAGGFYAAGCCVAASTYLGYAPAWTPPYWGVHIRSRIHQQAHQP